MNKKLLIAIVVVAALSLAMVPLASAKPGGGKPLKCAPPNNGQAGKSNVAHLYLYPDPLAPTLTPGAPWGKMKYRLAGPAFDFVLNLKSLVPGTDYTLITYEEDTMVIGGGTCTTDADCPAPTTCGPITPPDTTGVCSTVEVPSIIFNCLGDGTANGGGNVNIKNSADVGDLAGVEIFLVDSLALEAAGLVCPGEEIPSEGVTLTPVLEGCDTIDFDDTDVPA